MLTPSKESYQTVKEALRKIDQSRSQIRGLEVPALETVEQPSTKNIVEIARDDRLPSGYRVDAPELFSEPPSTLDITSPAKVSTNPRATNLVGVSS